MSFYDTTEQTRRDKILHAALKLFYAKGYFKTSVHEIREQADVSIGLLYRYFKNKEELAKTIYSDLQQETIDTFESIVAEHETASDCAKAIITFYFELAESYPEIIDFIVFARHKEIMPLGEPICSVGPPEIIQEMLAKAMENGEVRRMHPAVAAASLFGSTIRLIQFRLGGLLTEPLPTFVDQVFETAWDSIAVKP